MTLSVLEGRLKHEIPSEFHNDIEREFAKFEMETARVSPNDEKTGQATLTRDEIEKLPTTNQHGNGGLTVVQWQVVKGVAMKYGITDWVQKVDGRLKVSENIEMLENSRDVYY